MTYYVDWAPRANIDFSQFDYIDFAFALPDEHFALEWDVPNAAELLRQLVTDAHASGRTKVKLSIGGWTGSRYFSQAVSTPINRQIFVNNILDVYKQYNLDGIDIDWEYPGQLGAGGNTERPDDTENMLQFIQLLRQTLPLTAKISAAVQDDPFSGPDGHPIKDASGFAKLVDWILIMNYDDFEATNPPGPNAPMRDACGNSSQPSQNAAAGYNAWTQAGFPANQIVLGLPAYGYVVHNGADRLRQRSSEPPRLHRLARRTTVRPDEDQQVQFRDLVSDGVLQRNSDGTYSVLPASGFQRSWDECSATPFLHSSQQTIPYDDPESLGMKAQFSKNNGMGGVNMFDVHGDTDQWDLISAIRKNILTLPVTPVSTPEPGIIGAFTPLS
ncbi:glycoside hydrolase [Rhizopogon vinicolor AM-OR11-026]|uniref:Glycoside hydrolase n=1 Tax=Rhizopogon vinicolor AM-OR11-026 TaxID=1314800 RepID=A0A1B7NIE6_9AGAM|nr:glycoside hydrolase [Rhizopogon vinicolor AM-OR11-026]